MGCSAEHPPHARSCEFRHWSPQQIMLTHCSRTLTCPAVPEEEKALKAAEAKKHRMRKVIT